MADEKLGSLVITEDDRVFEKEFPNRGKFQVRIPRPYEKIHITTTMAKLLGGGSVEALDPMDRDYMRKVLTLDLLLTGPNGWANASSCSDEDLIESLWVWYLECEAMFRRRLRESKFPKVAAKKPEEPEPPAAGKPEGQPVTKRRIAQDNRGGTG